MTITTHSSSGPTAVSSSPAPPIPSIFTRPSVHLIHTSLHNAPGHSGQRKWREENLSLVTLQADYGGRAGFTGFATRPQSSASAVTSAAVACESGEGCQIGPERVRRHAQDHSSAAPTEPEKPLTPFYLFNEARCR